MHPHSIFLGLILILPLRVFAFESCEHVIRAFLSGKDEVEIEILGDVSKYAKVVDANTLFLLGKGDKYRPIVDLLSSTQDDETALFGSPFVRMNQGRANTVELKLLNGALQGVYGKTQDGARFYPAQSVGNPGGVVEYPVLFIGNQVDPAHQNNLAAVMGLSGVKGHPSLLLVSQHYPLAAGPSGIATAVRATKGTVEVPDRIVAKEIHLAGHLGVPEKSAAHASEKVPVIEISEEFKPAVAPPRKRASVRIYDRAMDALEEKPPHMLWLWANQVTQMLEGNPEALSKFESQKAYFINQVKPPEMKFVLHLSTIPIEIADRSGAKKVRTLAEVLKEMDEEERADFLHAHAERLLSGRLVDASPLTPVWTNTKVTLKSGSKREFLLQHGDHPNLKVHVTYAEP